MKREQRVLSIFSVLMLVLSLALPLAAQEVTSTPAGGDASNQTTGMVNCESSLILLAGLAQRYFGYTPEEGVIDLNTFEYGQYSPLFDMSTMNMGTNEGTGDTSGETGSDTSGGTGDASATETGDTGGDASGGAGDASATETTGTDAQPTTEGSADDAGATETGGDTTGTGGDTGMGSSVFLNPPLLPEEDITCTQLRASLEAFFFNEFQTQDWDQRFRSGMGGMSGTGTEGEGSDSGASGG